MPTNRRIFSQDAAAATGDASSAEGLVLHLDANDEDSIESGGANQGNGSGTWFDIANHDLNVPLIDKASNLKLHLNASDTTSYGGSGTTWSDISGEDIHATTSGASFGSDIRGYFDFSGAASDLITIPDNDNFDMASNSTMEVWLTAPSGTAHIINKNNATDGAEAYAFWYATNKYYFTAYHSGSVFTTAVLTSTATSAGNLDHLVITVDGSRNYKIYLNGTLEATQQLPTGTIRTNSNTVRIGSYGSNAHAYDGKLSVVRFYNTTLTASEVAQNYRAGNFLSYSSIYDTNLAMHLDAGDTTTVSASTWSDKVNSNDGTLTGFSSTLSDFYDKELGNWLEFDGVDDKVTNSDCNLDSANISITAWVWLDHYGTGDGTSIVHLGTPSTAGTSILFRERSNGKLSVYDFGAANLDTDNVELSLNTWHYVALTVSGTTYKLYVDGVEKKSGTETAYSGNDRLIIGNYNNVSSGSASQYWDGKMGVVKLYNVALTPAQVAQNYLATKNNYPNGNNGAITNAVFDANGSSPNEKYFEFNGSDRLILLPNDSKLYMTSNTGATIEVWVNRDTDSEMYILASKDGGTSSFAYVLAWYSASLGYGGAIQGSSYASNTHTGYGSTATNGTGNWDHVVLTHSASDRKNRLYVNGSLGGTQSTVHSGFHDDFKDINIGAYHNDAAKFDGKIAMVKIYKKELAASEVLANYNATKATFGL